MSTLTKEYKFEAKSLTTKSKVKSFSLQSFINLNPVMDFIIRYFNLPLHTSSKEIILFDYFDYT